MLRYAKNINPDIITKSGLMVGLGETEEEIINVFRDLIKAGCQALTIGQYLAPSHSNYPVHEYIQPNNFDQYKNKALSMGFQWVQSGPYVRSSFHAEELMTMCEGVIS